MPCMFPGMDPYLEDPGIFTDFHDRYIAYLSESLQRALPEPYYASLGRRTWIEIAERLAGPERWGDYERADGSERRRRPDPSPPPGARQASDNDRPFSVGPGAWNAGDEAGSPESAGGAVLVCVPHEEHAETMVEIYVGRGKQRRLVTSLELLSPAAKSVDDRARDLYLRRQREILEGTTHLVEIDLLRGGALTTAIPEIWLRRSVPPCTYHVCVHRFDRFQDFFVYPIGLRDPLPEIRVPLLPGDGDISIDLQAVFRRTYEAGPYRREVDYRQAVPPPLLSAADSRWVRERVAAGMTPATGDSAEPQDQLRPHKSSL